MHVLVADDDEDVRAVTAELFGRRGWEVTTVSSGEEASAALHDDGYDVAVLDQNMPPGSGMEVAAERRLAGDPIPIVLWTGWAGTLDTEEVPRLDVHVLNKSEVRSLPPSYGSSPRRADWGVSLLHGRRLPVRARHVIPEWPDRWSVDAGTPHRAGRCRTARAGAGRPWGHRGCRPHARAPPRPRGPPGRAGRQVTGVPPYSARLAVAITSATGWLQVAWFSTRAPLRASRLADPSQLVARIRDTGLEPPSRTLVRRRADRGSRCGHDRSGLSMRQA